MRVSAIAPGASVQLRAAGGEAITRGRRFATLGGERVELETVRGAPPVGAEITGPAVVELAESTLLVPPGWAGAVDESGTIRLTRTR